MFKSIYLLWIFIFSLLPSKTIIAKVPILKYNSSSGIPERVDQTLKFKEISINRYHIVIHRIMIFDHLWV
jgi:hypothetical protein